MTSQLERLLNDIEELNLYMDRVKKKGKNDLVNKLSRKRQFLENTIAEYQQQMQ